MKVQLNDIRHLDTWEGKEPINHSPAFDYCRKLVKQGVNPKERLDVYRGEELAYSVSSLEEGAKWKIREDNYRRPEVIEYKPVDEKTKERFALIRARKRQGQVTDAFK